VGEGRWTQAHRASNRLQHGLQVPLDGLRFNSENLNPKLLELLIPIGDFLTAVVLGRTIDLERQPNLWSVETENERPERMSAPELHACDLPFSDGLPELLLGRGQVLAQITRAASHLGAKPR
jgi:hypothetical protein